MDAIINIRPSKIASSPFSPKRRNAGIINRKLPPIGIEMNAPAKETKMRASVV